MDKLWLDGSISEDTRIAFENTNKFVTLKKIIKLAEDAIT